MTWSPRAAAVVAALAFAAAGCGSDSVTTSASTTAPAATDDTAAITKVITDYLAAYSAGDAATACALQTEHALIGMRRDTGPEMANATCEQIIKEYSGLLPPNFKPESVSVRVAGATASARVTFAEKGVSDQSVAFVKVGDAWRIDDVVRAG